jgi:hypothetical protein
MTPPASIGSALIRVRRGSIRASMMARSVRLLVPVLAALSLGSALAACNKTHTGNPPPGGDVDGLFDPDRDSPTIRAIGQSDWYTEQRRPRPHTEIWSRDYRAYLLDAARAERLRWPELMPGVKSPRVIGGSQWVSLGPTTSASGANGGNGQPVVDSGRINTIIPDGTRLFVATAGGGVWRRENNVWTPLTETVGSLSVGSLAMDPSNHNRLYLGLGDPFDGTGVGLLISTDSGDTWSDPVLLGNSMIIPQIMVDPTTPSIVLAATDQGLFRSTNSGASFSKVTINTGLATGPYVWSIASTGGKGFVLALGDQVTDSHLTENGQVWYSADDGATWTQSTGMAAQATIGRVTVASAPSAPQTVYAMAANNTSSSNADLVDIYKSTNGGKTWTALGAANKTIAGAPQGDGNKMSGLTNAQGWYDQVVLVDPSNANLVYFGGALMAVKTTDGGTTFRAISDWLGNGVPYVHADFHAGALDASGIYFGTDGGLFQSTDSAATFTNALNVGLVTHLLYSVCSTTAAKSLVLGGMQDNGTRLREGTTSTFDEVLGGDGFGCAASRTSGQKLMGSYYFDTIQSSADGGQSWNDATAGINGAGDQNSAPFNTVIMPWEGAASTGNELYTFTFTTVYKTTNFGTSWSALATNPPLASGGEIRNIGVAAANQQVIGVVGSGGFVGLSKDGGATWTTVANGKSSTDATALPNSDRSLSWIHFDVSNANTVYVASVAPEASVNHLWKSTDFGAHWASIDGNGLPVGVPVNVIKSDPKPANGQAGKVLYAGTQMGVYRSMDGGATWARFGSGMPLVSVTDLYISPDESIVRAASYGRGFWELTSPANDFSITANPASITVAPGASGTSTISTAVTNGTAQSIALTAAGLPSGATAQFSPTTVNAGGNSTLTLAAGASTPAGTYTVTITGTSPMASHSTTVSFTVSATNDFTLTVDPASVSVAPGAQGTTTVTTAVASGTGENIALTVDGLPPGVTATFAPTSVTAGNTSTLTLAVDGSALVGTYSLTVTGTSPSTSHQASLSLVIGGNDDFGITLLPSSLQLGVNSHDSVTVQTTVTSGMAEALTLTVDGVPTGVTATFDNASLPSGDNATLSFDTTADAPNASATVTVTATGPSGGHSATLALIVGAGDTGGGQPGGCCQSSGGGGAGATTLTLVVGLLAFAPIRRRRRR